MIGVGMFNSSSIFAVLALFGLMGSSPAMAAEISAVELDSELVAIAIEGEIASGDGATFRREAAKHEAAVVLLDSEGGSTLDALEIGEAIRLRGFSTLVINDAVCASACGLIWLAGTPRLLSQSAQVGFHATYIDEQGRKLESGVGNALVGRYLTVLNLPMKAIVFATMASPNQLNWLDRSNYLEAGIDTQLIEDFDGGSGDETATAPQLPPPIRTYPTQSRATDTSEWASIGHWRVMVDKTLGDSCFLITQFEDNTNFRIGFDRKNGGQNYLMLGNEAWGSLNVGDQHGMTFQFDAESPWEAQAEVVDLNGYVALMVSFSDSAFWVEFAMSEWLDIATGSRNVATLTLDQSRPALDSLIECQQHYSAQWDGRDPFAG
ncbi:hypothetical protein [Pelagerythrobacter sp.]|uniref:COG3904 family protein n=1 Tax=Pelagerythrobacter sp. TaxID=2800702 RepID=UPI0035B43FE5